MHATPPPLRPREWALLGSAYFSQFVAISFFFVALTAILRSQGMPLTQLSWIYLLGLVPGLRFLWAPLMDRYGFGARGHFGTWLALMQALLVVTLLALAQLDIRPDAPVALGWLMAGCLLMAFLTACQDMAADGLSCRLLGPAQRGLGNALQTACGMVGGFALGGGGLLMVYERWGWRVALISLTALNLVTLAQALTYREPPHARPLRAQQPTLGEYGRQLASFWRRPDTGWPWALLLVVTPLGPAMASGVLTPMLVDAGWGMSKIGRVVNIYASMAGVAAALALGLAMRRVLPAAAMRWLLPAQTLAVALLAVPMFTRAGDVGVALGVAGFLALYTPLGVLMSALMMGRASAHAPATDFSMQYGLYICACFAASALALPLAQRWGYGPLLGLAVLVCVAMVFTVPRLWRLASARAPGDMRLASDMPSDAGPTNPVSSVHKIP